MSRRSLVWLAASAIVAALLAWALVARAGIDMALVAHRLRTLRPQAFAALTGLIALSTWISALRWRLIAERTRMTERPEPAAAFALTALGVGLGQVLPVQLASALGRSLGGRLLLRHRQPLRTAAATLFEQGFDLALMLVLALASLASLAAGRVGVWPPLALAALGLMLGLASGAARLLRLFPRPGWLARPLSTIERAGALQPALLLQLVGLSAVRFLILIAMAWTTSWCAGIDAPPLALAAALPLVALATAAPITPAGFGVNEWTFAAVLVGFGVPLDLAAQWALVNRVLVTAASLLVALLGVALGLQAGLAGRGGAPALD